MIREKTNTHFYYQMIEEENEKNPLYPICLETSASDLIFASDNHLYHKICFSKSKF